ncbi:MAG: VCBS repeat-containing protein [Acidobacteria bacterium]|nr:VCBS repeat-containing protein [Acidobacteriota bacterium]
MRLIFFLAIGTICWAQESTEIVQQALKLHEQGKRSEALELYTQAIAAHPANPRLYVLRGMLRRELNLAEDAMADFDTAIQLNPAAVMALFQRGTLRLDLGDPTHAVADFDKVIAQRPQDQPSRFMKAIAYFQAEQGADALQSLEDLFQLTLHHAEGYALRGWIHFQNKRFSQARADFRRALWLKNDYPFAYYGQSMAMKALGDHYGAEEMLGIACGLDPNFCDPSRPLPIALLIVNASPREPYAYCVCCLIHDSEGRHVEDQVQALLTERKQAQLKQLNQLKYTVDFAFEDRLLESGITFQHRCTEDSARHWRPVHYDHGNSISIADVDGDGYSDVFFTTQVGENELWRNLGSGRFELMEDTAGYALKDVISVASAFGDVDRDGDPDLVITTVRDGSHLYENIGKGQFKDITATSGLEGGYHGSGAVFFDYDNDGNLDLYITHVGSYTLDEKLRSGNYQGRKDAFAGHLHPERTEVSTLYRNQGNKTFVNANRDAGLADTSWTGDAIITDLNGDRFPDLYVLNMQGDDHFYLNEKGKFKEVTSQYFPKTPWGTMGAKFFDFDNDGALELYLTDMHSDMSVKVGPESETLKSDMQWSDEFLQGGSNNVFGNAFYQNEGKLPLTERSDALGVENYWPWGLSVGDLNADGFADIFVAASMNFPWRYGINKVYLNTGKSGFVDAEFATEVEPRPKTIKPWFAVNCSNAAESGHSICKQTDRPQGTNVVWGTLGSRTSVLFDLDRDGDLDIITGEFNAEPRVLINNLAQKKPIKYLEVTLQGTKSNRDGLGAWVEVATDTGRMTQFYDGKSGYLSQSLAPLYFGLGNATKVHQITVKWPSGTTQTVRDDISINSNIKIEEKQSTQGNKSD